MEVPAVGELPPEAQVEALDDAVLPGATGGDVDGLDALLGHEDLDGLGDELRTVVGADVLGPGLRADHGLEDDADDVLLLDGGGQLKRATMRLVNSSMMKRTPRARPFLVRSITKSQDQTWLGRVDSP